MRGPLVDTQGRRGRITGIRISRRAVLAGSLAACVSPASGAPAAPILVGAIRWDAWYQRQGLAVFPQESLSPGMFRQRAPVHCSAEAEALTCTGDQRVIDAEIRAAVRGGLAFWAFDWFAADSPFRRAWALYQSSTLNHLIDWCPIVGLGDLGSPDHAVAPMEAKCAAWAALMLGPTFCKPSVGGERRPLVFILYREDEMKGHFGSVEAMRAGFDRLRAAARRAGAGNPYIVFFDPTLDMALFTASGADALSNYIARFDDKAGGTYASLDRQVRAYWEAMRVTGQPMVPIAQVGWDVRPRIRQPMPWDKPAPSKPGIKPTYYAIATPEAFAAEVAAAIAFVATHPDACPSRVVLAYSWDECDEGGCIMPTLGDRNGRYLSTLGGILRHT